MVKKGHTTGLVLSGGGAKGAFQAGVITELHRRGRRFDYVSGVSVGALNGAMVATGQLDSLAAVWETVTEADVLRKRSAVGLARQYLAHKLGIGRSPMGINDNGPLAELLRRYLIGKQFRKVFHLGFVNAHDGAAVNAVCTGHVDSGDLKRILASTAIPVIFDPVRIGSDWFVDGGVRDISPIGTLLPYQPDRMIVVTTEPFDRQRARGGRHQVDDILDMAGRTINIMLDEIFYNDIEQFLRINELVRQAEDRDLMLRKPDGMAYRYVEPLIISPDEELGSAMDFGRRRLDKLFVRGVHQARQLLGSGGDDE